MLFVGGDPFFGVYVINFLLLKSLLYIYEFVQSLCDFI